MNGPPKVVRRRGAARAALAVVALGFAVSCSEREADAPSAVPLPERVILISLDTLRADHLSLYGYPRPTTPRLEDLARRSVVFTNAMAQAPYTLPSHMTMMTGMHQRAHGVRYPADALPEAVPTLASLLARGGYRTAGFVDCPYLGSKHGFGRGFERYDEARAPGGQRANGFRRFGDDARAWIDAHADQRFFLFLHSFDAHGPYVAADPEHREALAGTDPVVPDAARDDRAMARVRGLGYHEYLGVDDVDSIAELVDDYDAGLRFVDEQVGRLMDHLESRGLLDGALVVITSDHGEAFFDHGLYVGHGLTLYEEEVRVPLLVKLPGDALAGHRVDDVVRLLDLLPTITDVAGLPTPALVEGRTLLDAVLGRDPEPRIATGVSPNVGRDRKNKAPEFTAYVRRGDEKYIDPPRIPRQRLFDGHLSPRREGAAPYDLEVDPLGMRPALDAHYTTRLFDLSEGERDNRATQRPRVVERIQGWIEEEENRHRGVRQVLFDAGAPDEVLHTDDELDALVQGGYMTSEDAARKKERNRLLRAMRAEAASRGEPGPGAASRDAAPGGRALPKKDDLPEGEDPASEDPEGEDPEDEDPEVDGAASGG